MLELNGLSFVFLRNLTVRFIYFKFDMLLPACFTSLTSSSLSIVSFINCLSLYLYMCFWGISPSSKYLFSLSDDPFFGRDECPLVERICSFFSELFHSSSWTLCFSATSSNLLTALLYFSYLGLSSNILAVIINYIDIPGSLSFMKLYRKIVILTVE